MVVQSPDSGSLSYNGQETWNLSAESRTICHCLKINCRPFKTRNKVILFSLSAIYVFGILPKGQLTEPLPHSELGSILNQTCMLSL